MNYDDGRSAKAPVTFIVNESTPAPVSELVIGNLTFDPVQEGYRTAPEKVFTVTNTGAADVNVTTRHAFRQKSCELRFERRCGDHLRPVIRTAPPTP